MAKQKNKELIDELTTNMNNDIENYKQDPKKELELLKYFKQFKKYSARNTVLIKNQNAGALGVASYKEHKKNGYQVRKGEKAIRILAPKIADCFMTEDRKYILPLTKANKTQKEQIDNGQLKVIKNHVMGYVAVPVFDITQTDCPIEKIPELYPNRPENYEFDGTDKELGILSQAISRYATEHGVDIFQGNPDGRAKGAYYPSESLIEIQNSLSDTDRLSVTLHELAHHALHQNNYKELPTNVMEYQAEMTAFVVSNQLGIDTKDSATAYLAGWTKRDVSNETYLQALDGVKKVSNEMIEEISYHYLEFEKELEPDKELQKELHKKDNLIDMLMDLQEDNPDLAYGEPHEVIYQIDDLKVYGGYYDGIRGVDYDILIDEDLDIGWEEVLKYGTVVVPEENSYISDRKIAQFENMGFNRVPLDENHLVGKKEKELAENSRSVSNNEIEIDDFER